LYPTPIPLYQNPSTLRYVEGGAVLISNLSLSLNRPSKRYVRGVGIYLFSFALLSPLLLLILLLLVLMIFSCLLLL
jgi:cellulose synthase/poly-beta-1,6-N-acetylglucosamine synthase-like glycosyltransferase